MKPSKCKQFQEELTFVGYIINKEEIKLDTRNLDKIREALRPEDQREIRRFLEMYQYYRQFIKGFANIAQPLYKLLKNNQPFEWTEKQEKAYQTLKEKLLAELIIGHSNFNKKFKLYTDASDIGLGAVLA